MDSILLRLHGIPEIETIDGIGCCCGVPTILGEEISSRIQQSNEPIDGTCPGLGQAMKIQ